MKTIGVMGPKGGVGKTTISFALAVEAMLRGLRVVVLDLDAGQASLSLVHRLRGSPDNPALAELKGKLRPLIRSLAGEGFDWLIIDGPPADMELMNAAILDSDVVLIPAGPRFMDVMAVRAAVESASSYRKPWGFVLNAVDRRHTVSLRRATHLLTEVARANSGRLLSTSLSLRQAYFEAPEDGKTGAEVDAGLRAEVAALWEEVRELAEGSR